MTLAPPTITQLFYPPEDSPFWAYDGNDPLGYLTILDSVGDFVVLETHNTHIAAELSGPWGMYQILSGHFPQGCMARAVIDTAEAVGCAALAQALRAALPQLDATQDPHRAFEILENAILEMPPEAGGQTEDQIAETLARSVEATLPRTLCADREGWLREVAQQWDRTEASHPQIWRARQVASIGPTAQDLAEAAGLKTLTAQRPATAPQSSKHLMFRRYNANGKTYAILEFRDYSLLADLDTQTEIARTKQINPHHPDIETYWRAADRPKFRLDAETMTITKPGLFKRLAQPFKFAD